MKTTILRLIKALGQRAADSWLHFTIICVGAAALVWFLVREIPKPSRASYVAKSFNRAALLARLRAALRHVQPQGADTIFRSVNREVDLSARIVRKLGEEIKLTPTECSLLRLFITHAGKMLTHRQLLTEIWEPKAIDQTQSATVGPRATKLRTAFFFRRESIRAGK